MLGAQYRLIAPDYPRIRAHEAPDGFTYRFDRLADITEGFVQRLGLSRFVMYIFDFGAPVGFRLAERHPEWIAGLICRTATPTSRACRTQPATSSPCDPRSRAPFFPEAGARAYLRDLPDAELYLLDTGHFALEDKPPQIAPLIADFLDRTPGLTLARPGRRLTRNDSENNACSAMQTRRRSLSVERTA